jgi:hypothetical protein
MRDNFETAPDLIETRYRARRGQSTLNIEVGLSERQSYSSESGASGAGSAAAGAGATIVSDITTGGGGDSGGRGCFIGTTRVDMPSGSKPICDIRVGEDEVLAFDGARRLPKLVTGKHIHLVDEFLLVEFKDGEVTGATKNHMYWTGSVYVPIKDLDRVMHWAGGWWRERRIVEKSVVRERALVYNLTVADLHNYCANGDAVSNLKPVE